MSWYLVPFVFERVYEKELIVAFIIIVIVNKKIKFIFKSSTQSADFFRFKEKYLCVYALAFIISFRVVDVVW